MDMEVKFSLDHSFNSNDSNSIDDLNDYSPNESNNKSIMNQKIERSEKRLNNSDDLNNESDEKENKSDVNNNDKLGNKLSEKQSPTINSLIKKSAPNENQNLNSSELDISGSVHSLHKTNLLKSSTTNEIETIINTIMNQNDSNRVNQSANLSSSSAGSDTTKNKSTKDKDNLKNINKNSVVSMSNLIVDEQRLFNKNLSKKGSKSKKPWYSVFTNTYKQKNEDFRRLFKLPPEEHLLVDYSCALQREILAHGRLYVSSNHVCFRANIIGWETTLILKFKEIRSLVKDKTAKIIPNAITIVLDNEKYFLTSFVSRDKTYATLVKVWQNALSDGSMTFDEISGILKGCYGEDLGYNSEDAEYEYYCKLKTRPTSDNLDQLEGSDKLLSVTYSSPLILGPKNLNNIDELNSFSDDQSNSMMKKELSESSSSSSFGRFSNKIISNQTAYQLGHRQSSSYDASIIEMNNSSEVLVPVPNTTGVFIKRPRSMVVEKSSQLILNRTKNIESPISSSSLEPAIEPIKTNETKDMNNNESKIDFTHNNNISSFSPITNSSISTPKQIEVSSSMIGQTSIFSSSPITSSPSENNELKNLDLNNNAKCSCTEHTGKELMNQVFNMSVNQLFECLFGHSEFCQKYWESRKFENLTVSEWKPDTVLPARRLEYSVDLGGTLKPKNTEDQKILEYKPDVSIVLESQSVTHGVPYSDSFVVYNRFCMTRISANQSRVVAHAHIHYRKKTNFIVKSFIERNSISAIRDSFMFLVNLIKEIGDKKCHESSIEKCFNQNEVLNKNTSVSLSSNEDDDDDDDKNLLDQTNQKGDLDAQLLLNNALEKNLPEFTIIPEKKAHISAISLSSTEVSSNIGVVKRAIKKKPKPDDKPGSSHHHTSHHHNNHNHNHPHSNTFHHTSPQLERSLSNQTQLVPIQKFSFFRWEVNVDTLVRLFIVAMICLMVINGMLYYKLRRIESLADSLKTDPSIIARLSNPSRQFEQALSSTGSEDSGNWQSIISNTLDAISKMEDSLKQLEKNFKNSGQLKDDL